MSDSFHATMKVTGVDPVKSLVSKRSIGCSRCDNLGRGLHGDDHTDDDMTEKLAESIEAFDQTVSRQDTHTVNYEASEVLLNESASMSQTGTARELPPPMPRSNTHVNENNITDTEISRNSNGSRKYTKKHPKKQFRYICRKFSIATILVFRNNRYRLIFGFFVFFVFFLFSQGCSNRGKIIHLYENDSMIVSNVSFFDECCCPRDVKIPTKS